MTMDLLETHHRLNSHQKPKLIKGMNENFGLGTSNCHKKDNTWLED